MWHDPLDIIWRAADNPRPVFAAEDLDGVPPEIRKQLTEMGILRASATATHVVCDACFEHHVEKVMPIQYPDKTTRFFIRCPENGRVEVPRKRLFQWTVDFGPILTSLATALSAKGSSTEIVPGRVWNLGRAALAGKSKPVWVARGLAWPDAGQLAQSIPKGRSPVLFYLGQAADDDLLGIPRESIIELRTVVHLDGSIVVGRDAIEVQLADVEAPPSKRQQKKQSPRDATVGALKRELHERILSVKSAIRNADDTGTPFDPPRVTQEALAEAVGVHPSTLSRAINESSDLELKIMLQTIENEDMIRKYSR
jgi:hypothetical protein